MIAHIASDSTLSPAPPSMVEEKGLNSSSSLVRVIYDDLASLSIPEDRATKRRSITLAETCVLSAAKEKSEA